MSTLRLRLAGTVMMALLVGVGGAALAQMEEETPPVELPTGPAQFETLEDDGLNVTATDPRMSGTLVEGDENGVPVPGVGWVLTTRPRLENDAGAWDCWLSEYGFSESEVYGQTWCVGEGAYQGLSAIMSYSAPDYRSRGIIYEGEPLWELPSQ